MFTSITRFVLGIFFTTISVVLIVSRLAFEVLGASTAPDDFALLKQRMPKVANWLFTTPWWVPTLIMFAAAVVAGWLLWSATRKATKEEIDHNPNMNEETVRAIVGEAIGKLPPPPQPKPELTKSEIAPSLAVLELVKNYLVADERSKLASELTVKIQDWIEAQKSDPCAPLLLGQKSEPSSGIMTDLEALGISPIEVSQAFAAIKEEVERKAIYTHLKADEPFQNERQKQSYHIAILRLEWILKECESKARSAEVKHFLSNFNAQFELIERQ